MSPRQRSKRPHATLVAFGKGFSTQVKVARWGRVATRFQIVRSSTSTNKAARAARIPALERRRSRAVDWRLFGCVHVRNRIGVPTLPPFDTALAFAENAEHWALSAPARPASPRSLRTPPTIRLSCGQWRSKPRVATASLGTAELAPDHTIPSARRRRHPLNRWV